MKPKNDLSEKEVMAKIRKRLKKEFPYCKFSVSKDSDLINIDLMEAPKMVLIENEHCFQINYYFLPEGKQLTEYGRKLMMNVVALCLDTDYLDNGCYIRIGVGRWNKPFRVVNRKNIGIK